MIHPYHSRDILEGMRLRLLERHLHTHVYFSTIHNSQAMKYAPLPMNILRKCGTYTEWNFIQPQRRMKFCHSQVNGWNWRTTFQAKLVRLRRKTIAFSPSYVDYRPKTNVAILSDIGHTKGRPHTGGIGQGKKNKNLNVADVLTV
jgi:hypothetical protein